MHDVESGNIELEEGKTLRDYITQYQHTAKDDQYDALVKAVGIDRNLLIEMICAGVSENDINEYGRFDKLCESADRDLARAYFERRDGESIPPFKVGMRLDKLLRKFILQDGFDIE